MLVDESVGKQCREVEVVYVACLEGPCNASIERHGIRGGFLKRLEGPACRRLGQCVEQPNMVRSTCVIAFDWFCGQRIVGDRAVIRCEPNRRLQIQLPCEIYLLEPSSDLVLDTGSVLGIVKDSPGF